MKHRPTLTRSFPLIDLEVERGGDGRTVTAYAATFDDPYEVMDQYGHYWEEIDPAAFNRTLGRGIGHVQVFYNHGKNPAGGPAPMELTRGIGVPLSIKAEARGLLTVTRYGTSPLAEGVLRDIKDGIIRAQSFRGPVFEQGPKRRHASGLDLLRYTQLGLVEYGPTPLAINTGAEMVAVRSMSEVLGDLAEMTPEERAELRAALDGIEDLTPPPAPGDDPGTADGPVGGAPSPTPASPASSLTNDELDQLRRRVA